jgi:hypothetical protein
MSDEKKAPTVTDEELLSALHEAVEATFPKIKDTPLHNLLSLMVDRLVETSSIFNEHSHPVYGVSTESDEYTSAGTGHTSEPASDGAWGCTYPQRIGEKKRNDF